MRILIAVHGFPPTYYAGAERLAERIVHWLAANGHEVQVFTIEKLDSQHTHIETTYENGFTIHRLFYDINDHEEFHNLYVHPAVRSAFQKIIENNHFDLVHLISGYLLGGQIIHIAKNAGIRVVVTLTEYWFMCPRLNLLQSNGSLCSGPDSDQKCARCIMEEKRRYRLPAQAMPSVMDTVWSTVGHQLPPVQSKANTVGHRRKILKEALNAADAIISPSRFLIEKFADYGYDMSRSTYIRHGLTVVNKVVKRSDPVTTDHLRLGYIGQIKPHKGTDLIIEAILPLLDNGYKISLTIWGPEHEDPAYAQRLRQRTANYPTISWQGRYEAPQVWGILADFDALLVPSRWYENSPMVIAEAFSMGLPVIATNLGGMAELIEHEKSGLLFELNNANDLRQQISRLLLEPNLLSLLKNGIPKVKTIEDEMSEIFEQYQNLVRA